MHRRTKTMRYEPEPERVYFHGLSGGRKKKKTEGDDSPLSARKTCACASARGEFSHLVIDNCVVRKEGPLGSAIRNSDDAVAALYRILPQVFRASTENFATMVTNAKLQPIGVHHNNTGGLNYCIVDAQTLVRNALLMGGRRVFIFHNHPSGDLTPSDDDVQLTKRLFEALKIVGMELCDHIVVGLDERGNPRGESLQARGQFPTGR